MSILQRHFEALQQRHLDAQISDAGNSTHIVTLPAVELVTGWNRGSTDVKFVVPAGYPQSSPDCFWTAPGLALAHGGAPQNSGPQIVAGIPQDWLWFSWHPSSWNSNVDDLSTFFNVIRRRLAEVR